MDQVLCRIHAPSGTENYQLEIFHFLWSHRSEKETDLVIISGDKSFNIHQAVILPLSSQLRELLPPTCPCTKSAICLPPFPSHVLTAAFEILYTGTTTLAASQEDQMQVEEVFALLKIDLDIDRNQNNEATKEKVFQQVEDDLEAMFADSDSDMEKQSKNKINSESAGEFSIAELNKEELGSGTVSEEVIPKNEPNDFLELPEIEQRITRPHKDIHSYYLNEVTGEFYKDERENVSRLDEHKSCKSQGQTAPGMILNEATGMFCYDEKQSISGLDECENNKINNEENVGTLAENGDVTPMDEKVFNLDNSENESFKKQERDITKYPKNKRAKRKNFTKLHAFGSKEEHASISSQTLNLRGRKRKANEPDDARKGMNNSTPLSVIKPESRDVKRKMSAATQSSAKFVCSKCDYTNKRKDNLTRHTDAVHNKRLYNCSECDYTTTWKGTLKLHIDGVHKNILYKCDDCDYKTNMKGNFKRHIDRHKDILYNCNECDFTSTWKITLKRHIDGVHKNILYKCDDCDYTTNQKDNLKRHIDGVHKKLLYNCNECDYTTTWKITLKKHIDGVHKNILFKCEECDYTSNKKENLKRHIDSVHKKVLYNCDKCDYTTTWESSLKGHIDAIHLNISHSCDQCDFTSKWRNHLKRHIQTAHKNIYFNCDQCEFKTVWKISLKNHIDAHEKIYYTCWQCEYKTASKGNFKRHIESAHENISYKCDQCNFTTKRKEYLQRHINGTHAGVSLSGSQRKTKAINKPTVHSRKLDLGEVAPKCRTRSLKMSAEVAAAVYSSSSVSENPGQIKNKADQKRLRKKFKTKGDADFLW